MKNRFRRVVTYVLLGFVTGAIPAKAVGAFSEPPGLIVEGVTAGLPGDRAGLRVGDELLTYDNRPLLSVSALQAVVQNNVGKKRVTLRVRRGGVVLTLAVPAGKLGVA